MLWNLIQEVELRNARASQALSDDLHTSRISNAQADLDQTQVRFDRMLLVLDAVWELVAERTGLTEADLLAKVQEIDARDGTADGRRVTLARRCSQCDAAVGNDRETCMFCGHAEPGREGIDAI